jgi:hypothetical protein
MTEPHVISSLRSKRAEISGHIHDLDRRVATMRANLANIDAAIRLLSPGTDPDAIPPKRTYRRTKYFARNEIARLALGIVREAPGPLAAKEIALMMMRAKGLPLGDDALCATVTDMLLVALRSLAKRGTISKTGVSRNAQWEIAKDDAGQP